MMDDSDRELACACIVGMLVAAFTAWVIAPPAIGLFTIPELASIGRYACFTILCIVELIFVGLMVTGGSKESG